MLLETLQFFTGVFVVVRDGQHALKFHLGRAREVVGPGVHFKWPIIQQFKKEETKHTTLDLEPQIIQLQDDLVYEVEAKLMYQIVDLRKAMIEVDVLVTGLQNRVVMAIQQVVRAQDRVTIRDTGAMIESILAELRPVEDQWGVHVLQFGFSNLSPSPASLEITQLDLLARERLRLYDELVGHGLEVDSAVALLTGAVVTTRPAEAPGRLDTRRAVDRATMALEREASRAAARKKSDADPGDDEDRDTGEEEVKIEFKFEDGAPDQKRQGRKDRRGDAEENE